MSRGFDAIKTVTIDASRAYDLAGDGDKTILTLTQDNNATQEAAERMAEDNWGPVMQGLKETSEK